MSKNNFYIFNEEAYVEDKKKLRFVMVKNPSTIISFTDLHPDQMDNFKEILPVTSKNAPEKLYRILTDLKTVFFLTKESFDNIANQVTNYLLENEDYLRLIVVKDLIHYYYSRIEKREKLIEDFIRNHDTQQQD